MKFSVSSVVYEGGDPIVRDFELESDSDETLLQKVVIKTLEETVCEDSKGETPENIFANWLNGVTIAARIEWYRGEDWNIFIDLVVIE